MATGRWGKQSAAARAALVELCAVLEKSELTDPRAPEPGMRGQHEAPDPPKLRR